MSLCIIQCTCTCNGADVLLSVNLSSTHSAMMPIASSRHFSTGSDNTLRRGLRRNCSRPYATPFECEEHCAVSLRSLSSALRLVERLSSSRQFTSRCSFCIQKLQSRISTFVVQLSWRSCASAPNLRKML